MKKCGVHYRGKLLKTYLTFILSGLWHLPGSFSTLRVTKDEAGQDERSTPSNPFKECGGHNALGHISPGTIGCGLG